MTPEQERFVRALALALQEERVDVVAKGYCQACCRVAPANPEGSRFEFCEEHLTELMPIAQSRSEAALVMPVAPQR